MKIVIRYEETNKLWYVETYRDGVMVSSKGFASYGECIGYLVGTYQGDIPESEYEEVEGDGATIYRKKEGR